MCLSPDSSTITAVPIKIADTSVVQNDNALLSADKKLYISADMSSQTAHPTPVNATTELKTPAPEPCH